MAVSLTNHVGKKQSKVVPEADVKIDIAVSVLDIRRVSQH